MSYNVKLDIFEGPLDLLLHLIKDEELDIYDIPIARITEQYLEYLDVMKALNLEIIGDYLVMASHLTYVKSRMLLPKHEEIEDELEDGADPREELIAKLVEYKKYKEAALALKDKEFEQSMIFTRPPADDDGPDEAGLLENVDLFELIKSFRRVLDNYGGPMELSVTLDEISVTDKISEIMSRLESADYLTFDALFEFGKSRMEVIATFLALLELMRLKLLRVNQARYSGEILIYRNVEEDNEPSEEEKGDSNGPE